MSSLPQILIFDFGSQYTQLIARRVRELNVYCEIYPYTHFEKIITEISQKNGVKGIILSGSPCSVTQIDAPTLPKVIFELDVPILGVCYGAQLLTHLAGGKVQSSNTREYGRSNLQYFSNENPLFKDIAQNTQMWMSHGDTIVNLPNDFEKIASTESIENASFQIKNKNIFGVQFHPEVTHSTEGKILLKNFIINIAKVNPNWTANQFVETSIAQIQNQVKDDKVILGLSGGVDSSVLALLLHKAIGTQLHCIFVDNGLLRKNEFENVLYTYKNLGLNIMGIKAQTEFYTALEGLSDPELKRKAIGKTFIDVFEQEAKKIIGAKWLAQGTIYPDVIESVAINGHSVTIKSHHNVGGLPEKMDLKILEPLRMLFKDEVRNVGKSLELPNEILQRHPFPGPGLAIRILGDITPKKVQILQDADEIFMQKLHEKNLYTSIWQAGAILLNAQSVGVMGDERTYENVLALRAVHSVDGMTADWVHIPYDILAEISNEIINKVRGINRVVYDISSKPPATIEWE
jgi:GMP synthase (glutamine-hydrolysing)